MKDKVLLFIDDNKALVQIIGKDLAKYYEVIKFWDPREALQYIEKNCANIDVVVSDYKMPHCSGLELLKTVKDLNPKTIRILLTGYIDELPGDDKQMYDVIVDKNQCRSLGEIIKIIEKAKDEKKPV